MPQSPELAGDAGFTYEGAVAAFYLSSLLAEAFALGVHIIGDRTVNPRGPRLFTTSYNNQRTNYLFLIGDVGAHGSSEHVRITGIRLDGGESSDPCDPAGDGVSDFDAIDMYFS